MEEWFCPKCKNSDNIVGGTRKMDKKKLGAGNRDWDKVDKNHFGPIPSIEVGMSWLFRVQVSEEGLLWPPVAGFRFKSCLGSIISMFV